MWGQEVTPSDLTDLSKYHNDGKILEKTDDNFAILDDTLDVLRTGVNKGVDSLAVHRTDINTNVAGIALGVDSLAVHRTEINTLGDSLVSTLIKADSAVITVLDYLPPHGAMNFSDSATVVALTQNVWAHITGPVTNLFTSVDADGITIAGDSITIITPGDYMAWTGFSFEGTPSDVFHISLYKNGVITSWEMHRKTSNNDTGNMGMPMLLDNLVAGDDLTLYIRNTGDNDDATLVSGQLVIYMIHPD